MKIKEGYLLRKVAGEIIVVPTGEAAMDFNGILTLNESAAYLWDFLTKGISLDELALKLTEKYEVDQTTALADTKELIDLLKKRDIIADE